MGWLSKIFFLAENSYQDRRRSCAVKQLDMLICGISRGLLHFLFKEKASLLLRMSRTYGAVFFTCECNWIPCLIVCVTNAISGCV